MKPSGMEIPLSSSQGEVSLECDCEYTRNYVTCLVCFVCLASRARAFAYRLFVVCLFHSLLRFGALRATPEVLYGHLSATPKKPYRQQRRCGCRTPSIPLLSSLQPCRPSNYIIPLIQWFAAVVPRYASRVCLAFRISCQYSLTQSLAARHACSHSVRYFV